MSSNKSTIVLLLVIIGVVAQLTSAAPTVPEDRIQPPPGDDQVLYDQRQNGTDNLRLQMSGVTVVVAPAEALLSLAPSELIDSNPVKPKIVQQSQSKHRLANLLYGILNKNHNK